MNIFFCLLFALSVLAFDVPEFVPNVVDTAGVLSSEQVGEINRATEAAQKQGVLVGILVTKSLDGIPVEDAADLTFKKWKLGEKGKDNGVLILVAVDDHKMRIEVGSGLEGKITDIQSHDVIRDILKPNFRNNNFGPGLVDAVRALGEMGAGEFSPYQQARSFLSGFQGRVILWTILFVLLPALIMGFGALFAMAAGTKAYHIRKNKGLSIVPYFFGVPSLSGLGVKTFLFINPGIFITLFPVVFEEDGIAWFMNILGVIAVFVANWLAVGAVRDLFSVARAEKLSKESKIRLQAGRGGRSSSRSLDNYFSGGSGSSSSSSSGSSWSSSDSSSSSSSSSGGSSSGGGSSGDW